MKLTLIKINLKISSVVNQLRDEAGHNGDHGDNGASILEKELEMFTAGYKACFDVVVDTIDHIVDPEAEINVPASWEKYFTKDILEYQQYLKLKEKYEPTS